MECAAYYAVEAKVLTLVVDTLHKLKLRAFCLEDGANSLFFGLFYQGRLHRCLLFGSLIVLTAEHLLISSRHQCACPSNTLERY